MFPCTFAVKFKILKVMYRKFLTKWKIMCENLQKNLCQNFFHTIIIQKNHLINQENIHVIYLNMNIKLNPCQN